MKIEAIKIEKLAEIMKYVANNKPCSVVAIKSGEKPMVHILALTTPDLTRIFDLMKGLGMDPGFLTVTTSDFNESVEVENDQQTA